MDFEFTQKELAFREEVRDFIKKEFPADMRWKFGITFTPSVQAHKDEEWKYVADIRQKVGGKGWLSLSWPEEYGGKNSLVLQNIVFEELLYHNVPGVDHVGVTFFAPTILKFGTEEQKRKYLPGIAQGKTYWCELLSEPDSGSDLASLKTTAIQDGDYWIINGQKTWTTGAHHAHQGFVIVRTDPKLVRHKGLSYFVVNMSTPGITINQLTNLLDEKEFNEVFFDNVRIPAENMVGGLNRGWYVTMSTLDFERSSLPFYPVVRGYLDALVEYFKQNGQNIGPVYQDHLAQLLAECEMAKLMHYRGIYLMAKGAITSYEVAADKLYNCELAQRAADFGMQLLGPYAGLSRGSKYALFNGWPAHFYLNASSYSIMGGTSEIDRNVIATSGLGLPNI